MGFKLARLDFRVTSDFEGLGSRSNQILREEKRTLLVYQKNDEQFTEMELILTSE